MKNSEEHKNSNHNNNNTNDVGLQLPNPHLVKQENKKLFHLEVNIDDPEVVNGFSNVKIVCIGGTAGRLEGVARKLALHLGRDVGDYDFSFRSERFSGFRVGPVFCCSHGMGMPSVSIALHEIFKLLAAAHCDFTQLTLVRVGTCGGIGVPSGTVIVSSGALNPGLKEVYVTSQLGHQLELPIKVDQNLIQEIVQCAVADGDKERLEVKVGKTYCADDFYQGQGRLDGSFCDYGAEERLNFFQKLHSLGVCNIEMESAAVLAMCHRVGIRAAVVCVALLDRLKADQPAPGEAEKADPKAVELVVRYITKQLRSSNS